MQGISCKVYVAKRNRGDIFCFRGVLIPPPFFFFCRLYRFAFHVSRGRASMRHEEPPDFHSRKHSPAVDQTCGYRFRQIASRATPQYPNQEMAHARRHARRAARNRAISRNGGRVENRGRWWENSGRIRSAFLSLFRHGRFGRLNCRVAYALLSLSIFLSFPRFFTTLVLPPLGKMIGQLDQAFVIFAFFPSFLFSFSSYSLLYRSCHARFL